MAGGLPPGIGNAQQALQATAFIRQQPWYQQWIASLGKTPDANGNVKLSDQQQTQLRDLAVSKGIGLNNKFDGIDENGQIVEEHHKLRNGLIAAAIGGAALTGVGLAGVGPLSGLAGGASAAGAGTGAGVGIGETAATGIGGLSATSLGLPVTAGLGTAGGSGVGLGSIFGTAAKYAGFDPKNPLSYLDLAGKVGGALGAGAKGAADGRVTQAGVQQRQDQLEQQRYLNELAGAKFALDAPKARASNSVKGDILSNAQDFAWGAPTMVGNLPVPSSTGGLRPSIFSENTRALGQRMSSDALAGAKAGTDNLPVPPLTPLPEAGLGSDILTTAGAIGGLSDALNPALGKLTTALPWKRKPPQVYGPWDTSQNPGGDPTALDPRQFPNWAMTGGV